VHDIWRLQFIEDWYYDPVTNGVQKKVKAIGLMDVNGREGDHYVYKSLGYLTLPDHS